MTDTTNEAERIAAGGHAALIELLRPAFHRRAQARTGKIEVDAERLDELIAAAADRADGTIWRRALAEVARAELGLDLSRAVLHPAVERAHGLLGVPTWEPPAEAAPDDDLAVTAVFGPVTSASDGPAAAASGNDASDGPGPAAPANDANDGPGAAAPANDASDRPGAAAPANDASDNGGAAGRRRWGFRRRETPAAIPPAIAATPPAQPARDGLEGYRSDALPAYAPPVAAAAAGAAAGGAAGAAVAEALQALRLAAVHLSGIETVRNGDRDVEIRLSAAGLDVLKRSSGAAIGRLEWREIQKVDLPRVRRGRHRVQEMHVATERGQANFALPGVTERQIEEHLKPMLSRVRSGWNR
ncbi:MAG: hypothetical protein ACLPZR_25930 [Solirubrobacteraceae bacterium]